MIKLGLNQKWLKATKSKWVEKGNRAYRRQVYKMFEDMLSVSAQFSGDFTSNWRIVTQNSSATYTEWPLKHSLEVTQQPFAAGDPLAIGYARSAVSRVPFNYQDKIQFVNPTPLTFTAKTVAGPDGVIRPLRPENIIPGSVTIRTYMRSRYGGSL